MSWMFCRVCFNFKWFTIFWMFLMACGNARFEVFGVCFRYCLVFRVFANGFRRFAAPREPNTRSHIDSGISISKARLVYPNSQFSKCLGSHMLGWSWEKSSVSWKRIHANNMSILRLTFSIYHKCFWLGRLPCFLQSGIWKFRDGRTLEFMNFPFGFLILASL